jgi:DedD protein
VREAVKHRLIGAAVLVALGVIVWPVIFDTSAVREISQRSEIPPAPELERFDIVEPERPGMEPTPQYDELRRALPETAPTPAEPEQPPPEAERRPDERRVAETVARPDEQGLPVLWAVQLGVFSVIENAQELKKRAENAGYHAILQTVGGRGSKQYRVYVEPKLERGSADALRREVNAKLGVEGFVTRYYP